MTRTGPLLLLVATALAACTGGGAETERPARAGIAVPRLTVAGLETVMGQTAAALTRAFGPPDKDIRETGARKLQFASAFCVLDAYLYPKGTGEPLVTYVDARQLDGRDIDRASCVASMQRRHGGK